MIFQENGPTIITRINPRKSTINYPEEGTIINNLLTKQIKLFNNIVPTIINDYYLTSRYLQLLANLPLNHCYKLILNPFTQIDTIKLDNLGLIIISNHNDYSVINFV